MVSPHTLSLGKMALSTIDTDKPESLNATTQLLPEGPVPVISASKYFICSDFILLKYNLSLVIFYN